MASAGPGQRAAAVGGLEEGVLCLCSGAAAGESAAVAVATRADTYGALWGGTRCLMTPFITLSLHQ